MRKKKQNKEDYQNQMPVIQDDMFTLGSSSDFSKIVEEMFDEENVKMKSDLNARQICKLNLVKQMAEYYDVELLKQLYWRFIALRVSLARKGRVEAVSMTQQIMGLKSLEMREKLVKDGIRK